MALSLLHYGLPFGYSSGSLGPLRKGGEGRGVAPVTRQIYLRVGRKYRWFRHSRQQLRVRPEKPDSIRLRMGNQEIWRTPAAEFREAGFPSVEAVTVACFWNGLAKEQGTGDDGDGHLRQ